jgi:hypothetical protein
MNWHQGNKFKMGEALMRFYRSSLILLSVITLFIIGCSQKEDNYVWVLMEKGYAVEVDSVSKQKPEINDESGKWVKVVTGPWSISVKTDYPLIKQRTVYSVHSSAVWRISDPAQFADYINDHRKAQNRIIIPLIEAAIYSAMTDYEEKVIEQSIEYNDDELRKFLEERSTEIILKQTIASSDTRFLDFLGATVENIQITVTRKSK